MSISKKMRDDYDRADVRTRCSERLNKSKLVRELDFFRYEIRESDS